MFCPNAVVLKDTRSLGLVAPEQVVAETFSVAVKFLIYGE